MQDEREQLDRVLDSALATYADPGPDSGLERRILSYTANEATPAPRRRWLAWAIALPVAAGLLLFMLLSHSATNHPTFIPYHAQVSSQSPASPSRQLAETHGKSLSQSTTSQTAEKSSALKGHGFIRATKTKGARALAPEGMPHRTRIAMAAQSVPLPKRDVFPTPQPLTSQEQAFALQAARMSLPQRQAIARFQRSEFALALTSVPRLAVTSIPTLSVASVPTLSLPETVLLGPPVAVEN